MDSTPVRVGPLHPKRLAKMTGAVAGLACALSVVVGAVAARVAPHGLRGIAEPSRRAHADLERLSPTRGLLTDRTRRDLHVLFAQRGHEDRKSVV